MMYASPKEKKLLIKALKLEILDIRYADKNTTKAKSKTSLDNKIKKRKECLSNMKCGVGKCGGSTMKCGSGKCGGQ